MPDKIYLNLLILYGILSQGIFGIFWEDDYKNSSYLHFRKKRVIDNSISRHREYGIANIPYIVKVLQNGTHICTGIIVSPDHILTAKICVDEPDVIILVESGELSMNTIQIHHVENLISNGHLVLLLIRPFIILRSPSLNRNIRLYDDFVRVRTLATISGWVPAKPQSRSEVQSTSVRRSVIVPVIATMRCASYYGNHNYVITDTNICTLEPSGQKGCTHEDGGSALVLGDKLVGVLIFAGRIVDECSPDVFIRVDDNNQYHRWIMSHIGPSLHHMNNTLRNLPNTRPYSQHRDHQVLSNQYSHPHTTHNQDAHRQYPYVQYPRIQNPHIQYSHSNSSYTRYSHHHTLNNQHPHNQYHNPHNSHE